MDVMVDPKNLVESYNAGVENVVRQFGDLLGEFETDVYAFAKSIFRYQTLGGGFGKLVVALDDILQTSYEFHRSAGTLTEELADYSHLIEERVVRIRLAHQPNLFPYLGILAQFFLLAKTYGILKEKFRLAAIPIYLVVDYDVSGDSRFRVSHMLDAARKGGDLALTSHLKVEYRNKPMYLTPKPPEDLVERWLASIKFDHLEVVRFLRANGIYLKREVELLRPNFDRIVEDVWESYRRAETFSEFNSFFLSRIVNLRFNLPILFVPGSKLHKYYGRAWNFFVGREREFLDATLNAVSELNGRGVRVKYKFDPKRFLFWYVCDECRDRVRLNHTYDNVVEGICPGCGRTYSFEISKVFAGGRDFSGFVPTVIVDDISDIVALGACGGVDYIGGAEHIMLSNLVAKRLGITPFHQVVWRPKMIGWGLSDVALLLKIGSPSEDRKDVLIEKWVELCRGKNSLLYYLANFNPRGLLESWYSHFEKIDAFFKVNYDPSLSPLELKKENLAKMESLINKLLIHLNEAK